MAQTINDQWLAAVNAGLVSGHRLIHKFGRNDAAGTSSEDVQYGGGTRTPLTAAVTMEAISASANDAAAGSHARTIKIWGVDQNFHEISETITMNGLSASSPTSQSFLRVNKCRVKTTGTYNVANDDDITVRVSGAGSTQLVVEAGTSVSQTSHYTVPRGETAFVLSVGIEVDSSKSSRIALVKRENSSLLTAPFGPYTHVHTWDGVSGSLSEDLIANHRFDEKTDVWAESVAGAVSTPLEFDYDILLIKNEVLSA